LNYDGIRSIGGTIIIRGGTRQDALDKGIDVRVTIGVARGPAGEGRRAKHNAEGVRALVREEEP
jgi:hypothetical protein